MLSKFELTVHVRGIKAAHLLGQLRNVVLLHLFQLSSAFLPLLVQSFGIPLTQRSTVDARPGGQLDGPLLPFSHLVLDVP